MTLPVYFQDQLRQNIDKVIEEVFPERMIVKGIPQALKEQGSSNVPGLLPFHTSLKPYQTDFFYNVYNSKGIAEFYTHAGDDIPMVSEGYDQLTGRQRSIAVGDEYTWHQIQADRDHNMGLMSRSLKTMRRATDTKLEEIFYKGDDNHNLKGFLNFPNVAVETLTNDGTGGLTTFASKTPAQMYRDLVEMSLIVSERSKNTFFASTMLLPLTVYNLVSTTVYSDTSDTGQTVLEIFLRNQKNNIMGIKDVFPVPYLDGKGTGGTGIAILYTKNSDFIEGYVSDYFHLFPNNSGNGQDVNFKSSIIASSTTGGTVVYQPLSMVVYDAV